jgi:orc1/cdc6 family replication initiation protein
MARKPLKNPAPLNPDYLPEEFTARNDEQAALKTTFSNVTDRSARNLHLHGKRGTGKTHLTISLLQELPKSVNTCYIPCNQYNTQYKALKQLYQTVTGETIKNGYHTSKIQRKIRDRTQAVETVVVLDEIDFLLLNDGNDLLYYLSRLENDLSIITVSSQTTDPRKTLEERTYSSLQPEKISFEPYTGETTYQILVDRAQKALKPQTLQRQALTYITSTTNNPQLGLFWLRYAAENTENAITESVVQSSQESGYNAYINYLLEEFTSHHHLIYEAIQQLSDEIPDDETVRTGWVNQRYQRLCMSTDTEPLSNRRISDYIKHLELLDLINVEYYYGGNKGKTREIELNKPT